MNRIAVFSYFSTAAPILGATIAISIGYKRERGFSIPLECFSRGITPPSRGMEYFSRGITPPSRGMECFSRGITPPSRGMECFSRGITPPSRGMEYFSRGITLSSRGMELVILTCNYGDRLLLPIFRLV